MVEDEANFIHVAEAAKVRLIDVDNKTAAKVRLLKDAIATCNKGLEDEWIFKIFQSKHKR